MKQLLIVFILASIITGCGNNNNKNFDNKTYEQAKVNLANKEKINPVHFLSISGSEKRSSLFGTTVYKGTIHNKATVIGYKYVRVKLLYFNAQGNQTANHEEQFDAIINAGDDFNFKAKYRTPKGTDSVAAFIMRATVVDKAN
ncbi:MAG: hypothetical protein H7101_06125 [Deinococcales bacterium]|nr:hypothetical protein [Chitinophagaceae bacterium]